MDPNQILSTTTKTLDNRGVQSLLAMLAGYGQQKSLENQYNTNAATGASNQLSNSYMEAAGLYQNQLAQQQADQRARAAGVLEANPLGAMQGYAQKQALQAAILGMLQNFKGYQPGGAIGAATPAMPKFDFSGVSALYSPDATMAALSQRQQDLSTLNPSAAQYDLSTLYGGAAQPWMDKNTAHAQNAQAQMTASNGALQDQLSQAIRGGIDTDNARFEQLMKQQQAQQQKSSGGSGFLGGLLKVAAPFAALIPGVGPLAAVGISTGANALGTKLQGGSWGDAAKSGVMGAATGALGAKLGGTAKPTLSTPGATSKALPYSAVTSGGLRRL